MEAFRATRLDPDFTHSDAGMVEAYKRCVSAENDVLAALEYSTSSAQSLDMKSRLRWIRTLGHLLTDGPTEASKNHIKETVNSYVYRCATSTEKPG